MGQSPIPAAITSRSGAATPMNVDAEGNLLISAGDTLSSLNMTTAGVIKATPGRLAKVVIINGGTTGGAFVFNDTISGSAAAGNQILYIPEGAAAGTVYNLDWPCLTGILLSAVPTGGTPIVAVSYS